MATSDPSTVTPNEPRVGPVTPYTEIAEPEISQPMEYTLTWRRSPWKVTETDAPAVPVQLNVEPLSSAVTWTGAWVPTVPTSANVPL